MRYRTTQSSGHKGCWEAKAWSGGHLEFQGMVLWESRSVGAMGEGRTCRGEMLSTIEITGGKCLGLWDPGL